MKTNLTTDMTTAFPYNHAKRRYSNTAPRVTIAYAYYRLSQEEANEGQSSSILNQEKIVRDYCARNGIALLDSFVDDGWSGGNFERPGFQAMMRALESGKANMVITKDLSRLGRDMRESSYYAEQFFPEHQIQVMLNQSSLAYDFRHVQTLFHQHNLLVQYLLNLKLIHQ